MCENTHTHTHTGRESGTNLLRGHLLHAWTEEISLGKVGVGGVDGVGGARNSQRIQDDDGGGDAAKGLQGGAAPPPSQNHDICDTKNGRGTFFSPHLSLLRSVGLQQGQGTVLVRGAQKEVHALVRVQSHQIGGNRQRVDSKVPREEATLLPIRVCRTNKGTPLSKKSERTRGGK